MVARTATIHITHKHKFLILQDAMPRVKISPPHTTRTETAFRTTTSFPSHRERNALLDSFSDDINTHCLSLPCFILQPDNDIHSCNVFGPTQTCLLRSTNVFHLRDGEACTRVPSKADQRLRSQENHMRVLRRCLDRKPSRGRSMGGYQVL